MRTHQHGEFLALAASFEHIAERYDNKQARLLGKTLDEASAQYLLQNKSPSRKAGELDNRGSHYYVATYWAQAMAKQTEDAALAERFAKVAEQLTSNEDKIVGELNGVQGAVCDIGGYYQPDVKLAAAAMRPSATLNAIIDA